MKTRLLLAATLMLWGCGGEDSGSGPGPAPAPTPSPTPSPSPSPTPTPATLNAEAAATYALTNGAKAVVILRGGTTILEQYANGGAIARGEFLASGTKSFTCVLGAAGEDDGFFNIEERVSPVLPPWGPGGSAPQNDLKQQIRAIDLLSLTSGLVGGTSGIALNTVDTYAQVIGATSAAPPNTAAIYGPNHFQGFSLFFELRTGGTYNTVTGAVSGGRDGLDYLQTRVFDRIGIRPTDWERDVKGKPNFGGGAYMTARDWARFGQFMEQRGSWNGAQVISAARLDRCVTYRSGGFAGYGLGWWLNRPVGNTYDPQRDSLPWNSEVLNRWLAGGKMAPSAPDDMYVAAGAGQRKLYVIPSQDLVVVRIGGPTEEDRFFQILYGTG